MSHGRSHSMLVRVAALKNELTLVFKMVDSVLIVSLVQSVFYNLFANETAILSLLVELI